ncbi:2-phospho-L-lactate guanylyltransferase [Halovivax gelatinilyticus]|uniref:2-phospho-L-lactate guanylyltransferase n=1 Tax=Halovivax gelatinilyticus TaxID=2961597 RepID=UPI0020CA32A0|nr:2-phospho-L-lactate guanylyltransferase [Halovivax gelatinilyticus]
MEVLVPFSTESPKSRLEPVLSERERRDFARAMAADVVEAIEAAGHHPHILSTGQIDVDVPVTVDERPLTDAVNARLSAHVDARGSDGGPEIAVVMADLAIATPSVLERLFETPGDVVIAPGRGGGTNAFVSRHPGFRVDYHGTSYLDHREIAATVGADVCVVDSFRLATDVDEPADLVEVLTHGDGRARTYLTDVGFTLQTTDGRVSASRPE